MLKQIKTVKVVPGQSAFSGVKLTRSDSDIKRTVTQAKLPANLKAMLHGTIRNDEFLRNTALLAMLEHCCNHSKQCRNNVATLGWAKNRLCESSRVRSP